MLKSSLLFFAAVLTAAICLPLAGRNPQAAQASASAGNPVKPTAESQARAKVIYKRDCALCHGDTGDGKSDLATSMSLTLDNWTDPKALGDKPDNDLFAIIRNGKGQMPSEDSGRADDTEVWNLIVYIRSFSKAIAPAPATATASAPASKN